MTVRILALLLLAIAGPGARAQAAGADPVAVSPLRGERMATVERKLGAPTTRHQAVGQPPITRWDYPGFSVYFESDRVIHTVHRP